MTEVNVVSSRYFNKISFLHSNPRVTEFSKILGVEIPNSEFFIISDGKLVSAEATLSNGKTYHFVPRVLGGKGGFGSMLRAIGAQIEKTTSREACRDLSGRRMRDINNEKQLKEWLAKEAEREKQREQKRQEKLDRKLNPPQHKFEDEKYHEQRTKVHEDLNEALSNGLKRANKSGISSSAASSSKKPKLPSSSKEWMGVDLDSDDLQSDSEECMPDPGLSQEDQDIEGSVSTLKEEISLDSSLKSNIDKQIASSSPSLPLDQPTNIIEPLNLEDIASEEELEAYGLETLKFALMDRGLKCGGTLKERASRLFSVKGLSPEQIDSNLIAKSKGKGKKSKVQN